ncbi:MAG: hypothetical protein WDO71_17400 [Bacteroidota bacterium]
MYGQIAGFVGKDAALQIQETIRNATLSSGSNLAAIIGVATLVIGRYRSFYRDPGFH